MKATLPLILGIAVADIAITLFIVRRAMAKRAEQQANAQAGTPAPISLPAWGALQSFTDEVHPRIGELVRMNWSGDPMSLPGVLSQALDLADREARARGLALDRETLKKLVETSLAHDHVAKRGDVHEALKQVA